MYIVSYRLKHRHSKGAGEAGFDAMIIILYISINYGISMILTYTYLFLVL